MPTRLGQHFLKDKKILDKIINAAELKKSDIVLEIGSGKGVLTDELRKKVKKVIAIEKDPKLAKISKAINKDILEINELEIRNCNKIIANIPYYITGKILRKFAGYFSVYLLQKEVAERICTKCKSKNKHSVLSISVQKWGKPKIISYVPRTAFSPPPKVDSAIVKIIPRKKELNINMALVKKAFSQKRKMLKNTLGIDSTKRPEELTLKEWVKLSTALTNS